MDIAISIFAALGFMAVLLGGVLFLKYLVDSISEVDGLVQRVSRLEDQVYAIRNKRKSR